MENNDYGSWLPRTKPMLLKLRQADSTAIADNERLGGGGSEQPHSYLLVVGVAPTYRRPVAVASGCYPINVLATYTLKLVSNYLAPLDQPRHPIQTPPFNNSELSFFSLLSLLALLLYHSGCIYCEVDWGFPPTYLNRHAKYQVFVW